MFLAYYVALLFSHHFALTAGVGAVYYAQVGLERVPEDRTHVRELIVPVVSAVSLSAELRCLSIDCPGLFHCPVKRRRSRHYHSHL